EIRFFLAHLVSPNFLHILNHIFCVYFFSPKLYIHFCICRSSFFCCGFGCCSFCCSFLCRCFFRCGFCFYGCGFCYSFSSCILRRSLFYMSCFFGSSRFCFCFFGSGSCSHFLASLKGENNYYGI